MMDYSFLSAPFRRSAVAGAEKEKIPLVIGDFINIG
jgi:hypothetical protein